MSEIRVSYLFKTTRPSSKEKKLVAALKTELSQVIGEIVDEGTDGGSYDLFVESKTPRKSVLAVRGILKRLKIHRRTSVDILADLPKEKPIARPSRKTKKLRSKPAEDSVHLYEKAISDLSQTEPHLRRLAAKMKAGGQKSKKNFINAALWVPLKIAQASLPKFPGSDIMDLAEEANMGLFQAVEHLPDWRRKDSLVDFLSGWIKKHLNDVKRQMGAGTV